MNITLNDIKEWFGRFNDEYFGGELPQPRLMLSKASTRLGTMAYRRRRKLFSTELYDFTIRISTCYDLTEKEYRDVLVHEMIHLYIAYKGLRDTSPHGQIFRSIMERLNRTHSLNMSVSASVKKERREGGVPEGKTYLVLALRMANGDRMLSVVNPRYALTIDRRLRAISQIERHEWFCSTDSYFFGLPAVRSLRGRKVTKELFDDMTGKMKAVKLGMKSTN